MITEDTDVAIVGAGGGGAVLALALAKKGIRTIVLDQAAGPPQGLRGELLQPNGQQVLDRLGVLKSLPADATRATVGEKRRGPYARQTSPRWRSRPTRQAASFGSAHSFARAVRFPLPGWEIQQRPRRSQSRRQSGTSVQQIADIVWWRRGPKGKQVWSTCFPSISPRFSKNTWTGFSEFTELPVAG